MSAAAKHTPGPWQVVGQHQTEVCALGDTPDAIIVADTRFFQTQTNPLEKEDARLIAAAPDLLSALRLALEWLRDNRSIGELEALEAAKTAIAKAEGRLS